MDRNELYKVLAASDPALHARDSMTPHAALARLVAAVEGLMACIPSHYGHWDPTGGAGSGCPQCQQELTGKQEIRAALAAVLAARGEETKE